MPRESRLSGPCGVAARPYDAGMRAFKAHVKNGRIVVDEPTDLPEGTEIYLLPIEGDELDDEERIALHASMEQAEKELDAGQLVSEGELWARLRTIP
jgi:hypothetical protein